MANLVRVARAGEDGIFKVADSYVLVDAKTRKVRTEPQLTALTASGGWRVAREADVSQFQALAEIADASQTLLDPEPVTAAAEPAKKRRVYRVPRTVREEALRALAQRSGLERGGTDNALAIASLLKDAQSLDIDVIARIARHAPRFSESTRETGWVFASEGYPSAERVTWGLWGGDAGQRWSQRIVAQHRALTAGGAFVYDDTCDYFGIGVDPESTDVNQLFVHYPDTDEWEQRADGTWISSDTPDAPLMIELDEESAKTLADSLDASPDQYITLSSLNPVERDLYKLASSSLDFSLLDTLTALTADAVGNQYTPQERAQNVQRQSRSVDGKFGGGGATKKAAGITEPKGRLPSPLELIPDPSARIDAYIAEIQKISSVTAAASAAEPQTDANPLYMAVVDEADTEAVLDVISLTPDGTNNNVECWKREDGAWVAASGILDSLRSISPPPVVELSDPELLNGVLQQVDEHDSKKHPQPQQPTNVEKLAIKPLYTALWGPHGEVIQLIAAGTPGVADTPGDAAAAERLRQYWLHGEGAAKIVWDTPGDWRRCVKHLSKFMGTRSRGYCQLLHHAATGVYTGDKRNPGNKND